MLQRLGIPPKTFVNLTKATVKKFAFVTAASNNHFMESQGVIERIQKYYPERDIIYFDLGLSNSSRDKVSLAVGNL